MPEIKKENLQLAVLALSKDVNLTAEELADAINQKINPAPKPNEELRIVRRTEIPGILGISLREVDRLITHKKVSGRIVEPAALPTVKIAKRAIGVLYKDLVEYINKCKRTFSPVTA